MIFQLPDYTSSEGPENFTDPFRYTPQASVRHAANEVIKRIDSDPQLASLFSEGKMLGVLVCRCNSISNQPLCYISAFSGNVGGKSILEGFVHPIFDLTTPEGYFKTREAEITSINKRINCLENSDELSALNSKVETLEKKRDEELAHIRKLMGDAKIKRERIRASSPSHEILDGLIRESQFEKAELKRRRSALEADISAARDELNSVKKELNNLKKIRAEMSDELQDWIFRQYIVHNAVGESMSIADVFSACGLVPPGGTGECAAPKLLEYAYLNGLSPLAMGEFWYGKSPDTAVRTHGHFYPSCTSKCGPLLNFMTKGLAIIKDSGEVREPEIIYEDESIIIVEKPSGMPSVPGLDGRESVQEWLAKGREVYQVHRLDMDTSGIIVFTKNAEAACILQRQFEEHSVKKTYMTRVHGIPHSVSDKGIIEIPLSADYDERPRQKVDIKHGKSAHTEYKIVRINPDGTTDILLYPQTGRTHQLRVHCAHHLGLGCPIVGDLLYGGHTVLSPDSPAPSRLHLHALSITFTHPHTGETMVFSSQRHCYK